MAKVSTSVMAAKAKKIVGSSTAAGKARGIVGKIEQLNEDAQDLRAAADGIRENYPPQIAALFEEVLSILRKADGYVLALGTNYGEVDHVVEFPPPMLTQKLHRAGRFIWDKDDMIPDWILRDIREQTQNTLRAWRNLSKAAYPALSTATGVVNGAIAVYDAATWTVDSTQQLLTEKTPKEAAGAICRDFVAHSGYRRYKLSRVPGKHAAWNEVCDFWAENDTAPFGESFTWPRPEDPMYRGLPPTAMRAGKSVVEAGCLPGENCRNDSYRYQYHIDEYGLRDTINPVLSFPTHIQNVIDDDEMDNLFDLATEVLDEAIKLLILLRQRLRSVRNELNRPLVKTALLALPVLASWIEVGFDTVTSTIWDPEGSFTRGAYHAARAKSERWTPIEGYENAVDGLSDAYNKLGEVKDDANGYWAEIPTYALMWRGGDFADAWRDRIEPYLEMAVERADDISTLINGAVWQNACDSLYPKGPGTWEARERYWEAQGVPSRCGAPVGSYMPTVTPRFDPPTGRQGGQFTPGDGKVLETVSLGAIATDHPGFKSWQKVALVGGLIWLITREK
jgi:hypothetical protein